MGFRRVVRDYRSGRRKAVLSLADLLRQSNYTLERVNGISIACLSPVGIRMVIKVSLRNEVTDD